MIQLLRTQFIPVAIDQAYQRRQQDAEGEFYREIVDQSPREIGPRTTQGLYTASADGVFLGFTNHRGSKHVLRLLDSALKNYETTSVAAIDRGIQDARYNPRPPEGGCVVRVTSKVLGGYGAPKNERQKILQKSKVRDNLWIRADERDLLIQGKFAESLLSRYTKEGKFVQGVSQRCFNGGIDPKLFYDAHNQVFGFDLWNPWDDAKQKPVNISISESDDATGAWNTYPVPAPDGRDGGAIGYSKSWIGYTFPGGSSQTFVLKTEEAKAGKPAAVYHFSGNLGHPVATQDDEDALHFVKLTRRNIEIRKVFASVNGTPEATLIASAPHKFEFFGWPPASPQKGTDKTTASGDRNPKNVVLQSGSLWFSQAVNCRGRSAVQWHQVQLDGTFVQSGLISDPINSYIQTTIAVNKQLDVLIGYQETGPEMFISPRLAYRRAGDEPGTIRRTISLGEGQSATEGGAWGDYSGSVVDGGNLLDLWTVQSIADEQGRGDTVIAKLPRSAIESATKVDGSTVSPLRAVDCAGGTGISSVDDLRSTELSLKDHPNIILVVVDDMGWQDTSLAFHSKPTRWNQLYRTPNMQRLAARGVRLTNAYAASPVCSPTRVSLMTGMNPGRTHITDWVRGGGGRANNHNSEIQSPAWNSDGLQPGEFATLPEVLNTVGYLTAHIGKAHFGAKHASGGHDPTKLGFEINIAGSEAGSPRSYFSSWIDDPNRYPHLQHRPKGEYITQALTAECLRVVDRAVSEQRPFFVNLAHYAIHTPIRRQGDPRFLGNYSDERPAVEQDYAAMIESMDHSLGEVLNHLEKIGIAEQTFILFTSDNGGLSNHTRSHSSSVEDVWKRDWHNAPLYSGKGSAYEGGLRVPMIVAWAGQSPEADCCNQLLPIRAGSVIDVPVHADDVFPTLLSVAQVDNPVPPNKRDGQDLSTLLQGKAFERSKPLVWHYPHQWYRDIGVGPGIRPFTALRQQHFKLVYFYTPDGGLLEFYDLANDLGEQNDLSADDRHKEDVQRLGAFLRKWIENTGAQIPLERNSGRPVSLANLPGGD